MADNQDAKSSTRSLQATIPYLGNPANKPAPGTISDDRRPPLLTSISFSPDSLYVCALLRQPMTSVVFIYSIEADQLAARIQIGAEGVATGDKAVRWSPSGSSLMVWSDWNVSIHLKAPSVLFQETHQSTPHPNTFFFIVFFFFFLAQGHHLASV
jgi:hypothetical protein